MPAMFHLSRTLRQVLALLMASALLWSVGAEACSDWIEHEQAHTASSGTWGDGDQSPRPSPAEHDKSCHACHHLQAHLAPAVLVRVTAVALPRPGAHITTRLKSAPDRPYHPPRSTILA
jgi:hypothetical protein